MSTFFVASENFSLYFFLLGPIVLFYFCIRSFQGQSMGPLMQMPFRFLKMMTISATLPKDEESIIYYDTYQL